MSEVTRMSDVRFEAPCDVYVNMEVHMNTCCLTKLLDLSGYVCQNFSHDGIICSFQATVKVEL